MDKRIEELEKMKELYAADKEKMETLERENSEMKAEKLMS